MKSIVLFIFSAAIINFSVFSSDFGSGPFTRENSGLYDLEILSEIMSEKEVDWDALDANRLDDLIQKLLYGTTFCTGCSNCSEEAPELQLDRAVLEKITFPTFRKILSKSASYSSWADPDDISYQYRLAKWCSYNETHPEYFAQLKNDSTEQRKMKKIVQKEEERQSYLQLQAQSLIKKLKNMPIQSVRNSFAKLALEQFPVDQRDRSNRTVLMEAVYCGRMDLVKLLVEEFGADIESCRNDLEKELEFAVNSKRGEYLDIKEYLQF